MIYCSLLNLLKYQVIIVYKTVIIILEDIKGETFLNDMNNALLKTIKL